MAAGRDHSAARSGSPELSDGFRERAPCPSQHQPRWGWLNHPVQATSMLRISAWPRMKLAADERDLRPRIGRGRSFKSPWSRSIPVAR
jgi:hypothetical protein